MPQRRPSYGSYGVGGNRRNSRISPPTSTSTSTPSNSSSTRHRLVPQSDASSVERWLTSSTLPTKQASSSRQSTLTSNNSNNPRKTAQSKRQTTVPISTISSSNNNTRKTITRGQKLLHDRIATTCSDAFAFTNQPKPPKRRQEKPVQEQHQVSRIIKQRAGKRFTFDDEGDDQDEDGGDQEIPAVVTDDSFNMNIDQQDQAQYSHALDLGVSRPGMTTPGVNQYHHNLRNTRVPPPPPPPPPSSNLSARPHRPTNATPISVSIPPPTHQDSISLCQGGGKVVCKMKKNHMLPFVKRHSVPIVENDHNDQEEENDCKTNASSRHPTQPQQEKQQRHVSPGSEGFQQQQQQQHQKRSFLQDDSISVSSSVTKSRDTLTVINNLDRHLVPTRQRTNDSNTSQGTTKSPSIGPSEMVLMRGATSSNSSSNNCKNSLQSLPLHSQLPSMRDLVSNNLNDTNKNNVGWTKNSQSTSISPYSCSVSDATSSTVVTTPTTDSQDQDEISQLTFPESYALTGSTASQTNATTSNAETKRAQNISRRDNNLRSIKVHPSTASKHLSLRILQPPDEEREQVDRIPRETTSKKKKSTKKTFLDGARDTTAVTASNASETVIAMQALLRKTNRIKLHIYDLVENDTQLDLFGCYFPLGQCFNALNSSLHSMGTGAYHVGIEVSTNETAQKFSVFVTTKET
jgi:hypothetical protein